MSTRQRSDDDFDREIRAHIEIETERLIEEGMLASRGAGRGAPALRQRHLGPGALLRGEAPALARSPDPGPSLRRAQHAALPGRVARRRPVARRRNRRHDGHTDHPRRHLPQATAVRTSTPSSSRRSRSARRPARSCPPATPFLSPSTNAGGRRSDRQWRRSPPSACARFGPATVRPASRSGRSRRSSLPSSA